MNKSVRIFLGVMIVLLLLAGAFSGGLVVGWLLPDRAQAAFPLIGTNSTGAQSDTATDPGSSAGTPTQYKELFKPFWEAWQIVKDQYVDQPVDEQKMMQGAIRGMLESLGDPHTSYMDPDEYRQANLPMNGEYEGIGAWVDTTGDYVKIVSPMPGSPAEKAGLKANDIIIKVDGEDMTGIDGNLVLRRILGPAGTSVTLTIQREGLDAPFDVTITRAKIIIPSVEGKMLDGNIAYIQLFTFGEKTTGELKTKLRELMAQNPKGLILDLRNNGGGYLNTAIEVVSQFIDKGVVMYEEYGNGQRKTFQALPGGLATKIPLVVLVNEGTASASEITAGAIQDYGRGILVGVTTYGKGSVQNWIPLENNQGAVRVTIARWLTPKERQISKIGLKPDVEVPLTEEDIKNGKDPQLDKAIEIINQGGVNP
ncbi:c-terminal peptidase [Anaerolinea thermolimosa]|uniref:S41 family peptidase n=1 Tax=Anaerolinea thermolimosa TaxID=229919 RepID=UPI0007816744|nr:S41 family peptidase [Anaerolinea thermolimosa]GAP07198.1 c-terminal peptidase [Anaerolinea thermolimosa]